MNGVQKAKFLMSIEAEYELTAGQLVSRCKSRNISRARAVGMYILHKEGYSYSEAGRIFRKNHATVICNCRKVMQDKELLREAEAVHTRVHVEREVVAPEQRPYENVGKWRKVYRKYKAECQVCGFEDIVEIHHIIAVKNGGGNDCDNLMILCPIHHRMLHLGEINIKKLNHKKLLTG